MLANKFLSASVKRLTLLLLWLPMSIQAATFTVNSSMDATDNSAGDGVCDDGSGNCTLRAAIQEANALAGADTIDLPADTYILSITGAGEDNAATGDLDISDHLTVAGAGATGLSIDGNATDRVFDIGSGAIVAISGVTIRNGDIALNGGGIQNAGGLTLNGVDIRECRNDPAIAGGSGAGIFNTSTGSLSLNRSSVTSNGNINLCNGSGIQNEGTFVASNSTISGNVATDVFCVGPAVINLAGVTSLNNTTISDNFPAGIWTGVGATFTLKNTIVAGNGTEGGADCPDSSLSMDSLGYNLIGSAGCTFNSAPGDQIGTETSPIDAELGRPISSPRYVPLLVGGPAIDAGNPAPPGSGGNACEATDQRGVARPQGVACDIGAYEFTAPGSATTVFANSGTPQDTRPPFRTFAVPLEAAVLDGIGSPVSGLQVTFTAPGSGASGTFADTGTPTTTALSDESGIATAPAFTANEIFGSYVVTATASGVATPAEFLLTNTAFESWYVAPDGNNGDDCLSPTTPCATIDGALNDPGFTAGDTVLVASGTYTDTGDQVVLLDIAAALSGGWNASFTSQNGVSIIDGEEARQGVIVDTDVGAVIERFRIHNGSALTGGGIYNGGTLIVSNSVVTDNAAQGSGGGISNGGNPSNSVGTLTLNDSTVSNNTADEGGGVYSYVGSLTLNNSTVSANTAGDGGGLYIYCCVSSDGGTAILSNSTLSGNSAVQGGGVLSAGTLTLNHSTVSGNTAASDGGGIYNTFNGTATLTGSLVGHSPSGGDCGGAGPITDGGNNLADDTSCGTIPDTLTGLDPALADHGGPTLTHALLEGSNAIDLAGDCGLATDQRLFLRDDGSCDSGSFEFGPEIFSDGFESGDTSAWSSTVP